MPDVSRLTNLGMNYVQAVAIGDTYTTGHAAGTLASPYLIQSSVTQFTSGPTTPTDCYVQLPSIDQSDCDHAIVINQFGTLGNFWVVPNPADQIYGYSAIKLATNRAATFIKAADNRWIVQALPLIGLIAVNDQTLVGNNSGYLTEPFALTGPQAGKIIAPGPTAIRPTVTPSWSGSVTITAGNWFQYEKVGSLVFCTFKFQITAVSGSQSAGANLVFPLPFPCSYAFSGFHAPSIGSGQPGRMDVDTNGNVTLYGYQYNAWVPGYTAGEFFYFTTP